MKLKCIKNGATDRVTKERYVEGIEYDFEKSRGKELLKTKYFEEADTTSEELIEIDKELTEKKEKESKKKSKK